MTCKRADRYYRAAIYAPAIRAPKREEGRRRGIAGEIARRGSPFAKQPVGSFADYPRVTDRTARGQSKQVVSLHFARSGAERRGGMGRENAKERDSGRGPSRAVSVIKPGVMVI